MDWQLKYIKTFCLLLFLISGIVVSGQESTIIFIPNSELVTQVEWSPDGSKLATMSSSEIIIFDTQTWGQISTIINSYVYDISWSPDSQYLVGVRGGITESIIIWDTTIGDVIHEGERPRPDDAEGIFILHSVAWHPNGEVIATDASIFADEILLWDTNFDNPTVPRVVDIPNNIYHNSINLAWSHNGEMLLSSGADALPPNPNNYMTETQSYLIDVNSGEVLFTLSEPVYAWGNDDKRIASVSIVNEVSRQITIWDIATQKPLLHFSEHTTRITSIAWSTQSPVIASADIDDNLFIWNADTGIPYETNEISLSGLSDLAWKPDSDILAIVGNEGVLVKQYQLQELP